MPLPLARSGMRYCASCAAVSRRDARPDRRTRAGGHVQIDEWLLDILACPKCHAKLRADDAASELVCTGADCGLAYPVRDDIPVLLIDEARAPAGTGQE